MYCRGEQTPWAVLEDQSRSTGPGSVGTSALSDPARRGDGRTALPLTVPIMFAIVGRNEGSV
jgi:hypothetical protein